MQQQNVMNSLNFVCALVLTVLVVDGCVLPAREFTVRRRQPTFPLTLLVAVAKAYGYSEVLPYLVPDQAMLRPTKVALKQGMYISYLDAQTNMSQIITQHN